MKTLLVGYKAADLSRAVLRGDVTCHVLDIYHRHAIEKVFPGVRVVCSPHLPADAWDLIRFRTGPKLMGGELSLDLFQEIHRLGPKALDLDYVGRERDRNDLLDRIRNDPGRVRIFRADWPASVPGGEKLIFSSFPGCFCHRRLDAGGLALAEVVTRELADGSAFGDCVTGRAQIRLLDMGCGCGLVGLLIAKRIPGVSLTMVDSHTRAVEAARLNAGKFGVAAEVLLADDGLDSAGPRAPYDLFVGNPPYYSDYRIAEVFLGTAKKTLRPGGVCYTVVKNEAGLKPLQERFFPRVEVIPRRGYAVLKSVCPPN